MYIYIYMHVCMNTSPWPNVGHGTCMQPLCTRTFTHISLDRERILFKTHAKLVTLSQQYGLDLATGMMVRSRQGQEATAALSSSGTMTKPKVGWRRQKWNVRPGPIFLKGSTGEVYWEEAPKNILMTGHQQLTHEHMQSLYILIHQRSAIIHYGCQWAYVHTCSYIYIHISSSCSCSSPSSSSSSSSSSSILSGQSHTPCVPEAQWQS